MGKKLLLLEASSVNDLCRLVYGSGGVNMLYSTSYKGKDVILAFGPAIGDVQLAFYKEAQAIGNYLAYVPPVEEVERVEFVERADEQSKALPIANADFSELISKAEAKAKSVEFGSLLHLAKASVMHAANDEKIPYLLVFPGKESVFGAFDIIGDLQDDEHIFYFAKGHDEGMPLLRYDYKEDKVEFVSKASEQNYLYIRLIRLLEPLPFGKGKEKKSEK